MDKKDCATHETIIMDRLTKVIEDKVEFSVTMKMSILTKWIIGTILTVIGLILFVIISNSYYMGKMDAQYASVLEYIKEQKIQNQELKQLNNTLSKTLDETVSNQMVILANMKRLDPTFTMPFQLRGGVENKGN